MKSFQNKLGVVTTVVILCILVAGGLVVFSGCSVEPALANQEHSIVGGHRVVNNGDRDRGLANEPAEDQPIEPENEPTDAELTAQRWEEIRPIFQEYYDRQIETAKDGIFALNRDLVDMANGIKTEEFANELLSFEAMGTALSDNATIKQFLVATFSEHVVDLDDLERAISIRFVELNQKFIQLDNELLIACGVDVEFDPAKVDLSTPDLSSIHQDLSKAIPSLERMLENAFATNIISTGAGLAAGSAGYELGRYLGQDENGDNTWGGEILGLGFGAAAGWLAEEATSEAVQTKQVIEIDTHNIARNLMLQTIITENHSPHWSDAMASQCGKHISVCIDIVADNLEVDRQLMIDIITPNN